MAVVIAVTVADILTINPTDLLMIVPSLFRPLIIRLTSDRLEIDDATGTTSKIAVRDIIRCEPIDYRMNWWSGPAGPGLEFPSSAMRRRGNRGLRLDLADGLHLLLGTEQPERLAELIRRLKSAPATA